MEGEVATVNAILYVRPLLRQFAFHFLSLSNTSIIIMNHHPPYDDETRERERDDNDEEEEDANDAKRTYWHTTAVITSTNRST